VPSHAKVGAAKLPRLQPKEKECLYSNYSLFTALVKIMNEIRQNYDTNFKLMLITPVGT
jgi:hypothetical protein